MPDVNAINQYLQDRLQRSAWTPFSGSEYPMPVSQAMLGKLPDVSEVTAWLSQSVSGELKNLVEPVAVAAELIESNEGDRDQFFIDDDTARGLVFNGAKWRAGWILVAGDGVSDSLVKRLSEEQYLVFSSHHESLRARALPDRETQAVYFLQLMVRYAMIWGRIPPGEDHEMGHFLERDMPGAMIVKGSVGEVEGLLLLALMKMGCPAVVDRSFPYDIGYRAVAESEDDIIKAIREFPNMRVRVFEGARIAFPEGSDPIHAKEKFDPERTVRGVFQLRPANCEAGASVSGDRNADGAAIIVRVSDPKLDLPISAHLEEQALHYISYIRGTNGSRDDNGFRIDLAGSLDAELLGEAIRCGLKHSFPRLGDIRVDVEFGEAAVLREEPLVEEFNSTRDAAILAESEDNTDEFHACIDCQPFSHKHVCIITPDRPPMCGRGRNAIKAAALWGADYRPWTRRELAADYLQYVVPKGQPIDKPAGEWTGVNRAANELTGGQIERVRLHSVFEYPHTSCGCFGALAFRIPGTDSIGIMHRSYKGTAPGGLTWRRLANQAGGKQSPGVTGITLAYLRSPKVLAGDGGLSAVKWITRKAYEIIRDLLPEGTNVTVADDAENG